MNGAGKIRIAILVVILLGLSYFSVGYAYEIFVSSVKEYFIDTNNINDINIDGADFTMIFRLMGAGLNSILSLFLYGIYAVVVFLASLILVIPFRLIGLRKSTELTALEISITKWVFIVGIILSLIVGVIITRCTVLIPLLIYTAIWALIVFFIYVLSVLRYTGSSI